MRQRRGSVNSIDILVCACIVIIIAAVLFPIYTEYTRCRIPARPASCQRNLKECAVALQLYWTDWDGRLPSSTLVNHSKKWNQRDFLTFATKRGVLPSSLVMHRRTWPEILYDHMINKDIMFCPYDPAWNSANPQMQVSYWYKLAIDKAWYGDGCVKPCRKESDFVFPADQIVFYEHKSFDAPERFGISKGQVKPLVDGTVINVAFMDSHIQTVTIKNATSGDPNNCAANMDGEPMYFNADGMTGKKISAGVPAKYVDPGRYADNF